MKMQGETELSGLDRKTFLMSIINNIKGKREHIGNIRLLWAIVKKQLKIWNVIHIADK